MDELRQLRARHDALPDPAPDDIAAARSRLSAHMRRSPSRTRPRIRPLWAAAGLAGATALAVLAATTAGGTGEDTGTTPVKPVANAEDLASNAAKRAEGERAGPPRPSQWAYVKDLVAQLQLDGGPPVYGRPKARTLELWRRLDDTAFARIENGRLRLTRGQEFEVTYGYLRTLPARPGDLLARVYKQVEVEDAKRRTALSKTASKKARAALPPPMTAESRNMYAFQHLALGMRQTVLPARLRAAMYGAMAKIPGVRYAPRADDLAGRPGVTLYRIQDGHMRDEVIIDPKTYEYMGYRSFALRDYKGRGYYSLKKGQLVGWSSQLTAAIVEQPGHRR